MSANRVRPASGAIQENRRWRKKGTSDVHCEQRGQRAPMFALSCVMLVRSGIAVVSRICLSYGGAESIATKHGSGPVTRASYRRESTSR